MAVEAGEGAGGIDGIVVGQGLVEDSGDAVAVPLADGGLADDGYFLGGDGVILAVEGGVDPVDDCLVFRRRQVRDSRAETVGVTGIAGADLFARIGARASRLLPISRLAASLAGVMVIFIVFAISLFVVRIRAGMGRCG